MCILQLLDLRRKFKCHNSHNDQSPNCLKCFTIVYRNLKKTTEVENQKLPAMNLRLVCQVLEIFCRVDPNQTPLVRKVPFEEMKIFL